MTYEVSVVKDGQAIATERVENPKEGDVTAAIGRVTAEARKKLGGPLWPATIDVRHA